MPVWVLPGRKPRRHVFSWRGSFIFQLDHDRKGSLITSKMNSRTDRTTCWQRLQPKVWNFLHSPNYSKPAKLYGFISLFFVILSIFSFIASTTPTFQRFEIIQKPGGSTGSIFVLKGSDVSNDTSNNETSYRLNETKTNPTEHVKITAKHSTLIIIDIICLVFFTLEYTMCILFAPRKLKFITSVIGVIDVLAILPDYIEMIVYAADPEMVFDSTATNLLAFLKIFRVLRIFRLIRHVPGLWILVYTLKASVGELVLLACFMTLGVLIFSSLIYFVEDRAHFETIPDGFWWALITMTTVGYGDMYPYTTLGKIVGCACALSGLLMIGFSVPALVNNFVLYYKHMQFAIEAEREAEKSKNMEEKPAVIRMDWKEENENNNGEMETFIQSRDESKCEEKDSVWPKMLSNMYLTKQHMRQSYQVHRQRFSQKFSWLVSFCC